MTSSQRQILNSLNAVENKRMTYYELRKSVGLTIRGFRSVVTKMQEARLLVVNENEVEITFGGLRDLA